jgi:hypothetical protein
MLKRAKKIDTLTTNFSKSEFRETCLKAILNHTSMDQNLLLLDWKKRLYYPDSIKALDFLEVGNSTSPFDCYVDDINQYNLNKFLDISNLDQNFNPLNKTLMKKNLLI